MMENQDQSYAELSELMASFRSLQQRLLQEVINSHAETEMTLKQLVAYLNISAQNLTEVHNVVNQFNSTVEALKIHIENQNDKMDNIEEKVNSLPNETYKVKDIITQNFSIENQAIAKYLTQTNEYLKKLYQMVGQQGQKVQSLENNLSIVINTIESDLDKNHESLTQIINTLIENKTEIDSKSLDVKASAVGQGNKKYEIKLKFWAKVIGIFFASGGFLYTIIEMILKSAAK